MDDDYKPFEPLSATANGTFAFKTIKDRLPVIITKGIDFISRFRSELIERYGEEAIEDVKGSIERLSQLRYELTTDKPYTLFQDNCEDAKLWNAECELVKKEIGEENFSWFKGPWLFAECYMYRRIREAMLLCKSGMKDYDPFEKAKIETCRLSQKSTSSLISKLCPLKYDEEKNDLELLKKRFHNITRGLLWSNKNDLSISSGNDVSSKVNNLIDLLESFEENILSDDTNNLWNYLNELKKKADSNHHVRIDIVLDNCGIELGSDLILCDFLLRNEYAEEIILHAKAYSWFISDVTKIDFDYLMRMFQSENSMIINKFQARIQSYLKTSKLILEHQNLFWTLGYSFHDMPKVSPETYSSLKSSSLVIMKGDLNYRKLIGDLNWPYDTKLQTAIKDFKPASLCSFRTIKSDLIANIDTNELTNKRYGLLKKNTAMIINGWLVVIMD